MVNLILTDSYFNLFPTLTNCLKERAFDIKAKKLVFCEAKSSLMIERYICNELGGTFNTEVYSFGKFLRARKSLPKVLTEQGSAMAIKRILSQVSLNCFKRSKDGLAPKLYNLFIQLKSAKITPLEILRAVENTNGILKNKLEDVYTLYTAYEKFLSENGFEDQSALFSYIPEVIENSKEIASADVFLIGYSSFTAQMRSAIVSLMDKAKSVTAILVEGDNHFAYVNETASFIRSACKEHGFNLLEKREESSFTREGKIIADYIFNPVIANLPDVKEQSKIYYQASINPYEEITRVGEVIRQAVLNGNRKYKDFTIATDNIEIYRDHIATVFNALDIPYYLDEQVVPLNHPLVTLIFSYVDCFRKGFDRQTLTEFFKNPLFLRDKELADLFENYLIKYNINYRRILDPFTYPAKNDAELKKLEEIRQKIVSFFDVFDVQKMLEKIGAKDSLIKLAEELEKAGDIEQAKITEQVYEPIINLLEEMKSLLFGVKLSLIEYKNLLISGVSALTLSIIPQYNDAVFIGGFKETALAKAKSLFVIGLTNDVPGVQTDVALLCDDDIQALENIKILVEPKIRVVNHRTREKVAMALSAYSEELYLSYPTSTVDGKKTTVSEIIDFFKNSFKLNAFPKVNGYLSKAQGFKTFARECGAFTEGKKQGNFDYDFTIPSSFYKAVDGESLDKILSGSKKQVKERLEGNNVSLIGDKISPTTIEEYYTCPYKAFISHVLKVKSREDCRVDALSVGNFAHAILNKYVNNIASVTDEQSSNALFEKVSKEVLGEDRFSKFLTDSATRASVNRVMVECKEYCYKTYLALDKSNYSLSKTEAKFGNGEDNFYPAIPLHGGKVEMEGKIDRVDEGNDYFRVLDYKTGGVDATEKALFMGVKLQLYLYALAVMEKYKDEKGKFPSGLYYLPISNKYESEKDKDDTLAVGKTLNEKDAVISQDKEFFENGFTDFVGIKINPENGEIDNAIDRKTFESYIDYAKAISELAVTRLKEGVILPSPSPYDDSCKYCEYSALCGQYNAKKRNVGNLKGAFNLKKGDK